MKQLISILSLRTQLSAGLLWTLDDPAYEFETFSMEEEVVVDL